MRIFCYFRNIYRGPKLKVLFGQSQIILTKNSLNDLRCYKTIQKKLSLYHKLWFSNSFSFATQCCRPYILQTFNSVRSNNLNLKYHRFTPPWFAKIKGIRNLSLWLRLNTFDWVILIERSEIVFNYPFHPVFLQL